MKKFYALFLLIFLLSSSVSSQNLFINEVVTENVAGEMDGLYERDDWVEIYNTGGITNLAGYYLSDDPLIPNKWLIPSTNAGTTTVLPNNHIIFWCDRDPEQGENHVDFSLNIDGETIMLVAPDGVTVIDQVEIPQLAPDISWGRTCDGCPDFQYFNNVTFDDDNFEIIPTTPLVLINEVMVNNTSYWKDLQNEYEPWIEIFNPQSTQVNLAGAVLELSTGENWTIPSNDPLRTVLLPGGFAYFWLDGESLDGLNHSTFSVSNTNFTISIKGNNGVVLDSFDYTPTSENQSRGSTTDGSTSISTFNAPTPGLSNTIVIIPAPELYINEVLASSVNDIVDELGQAEDWFEIYNPGPNAINLAGFYISDNPENPRKWQVPFFDTQATTIQANDWILFWADEDQTQGITHTSFRLNNTSESLRLTTPDGITLVDEISWQGLDADTSYGRLTDGNPTWVLFTGTTPDASNNQGIVSVLEQSQKTSLNLYPNPTVGLITLSEQRNISVYNMSGSLMDSKTQVTQYDFSALSTGIYFLRTDTGEVFRVIRH